MKKAISLLLSACLAVTVIGATLASAKQEVIGKRGDANLDGTVDIIDIVLMRSHIVKNSTLTGLNFTCADVNDDGVVDIVDVVMTRSAIVNSNDLGNKTTDVEDTQPDVQTDTDTQTITDTETETDTDTVTDTDAQTDTDSEFEPVTMRFEAEASSNSFSGTTNKYTGVGSDNYKQDFAGTPSGDGYVRLEVDGAVSIPFTADSHGIYNIEIRAYSTGKTVKAEITPSSYSKDFAIKNYKDCDNGWDVVSDAGIELEAGRYNIVLSCTNEVYNVCVDYVEITLTEIIADSETDTDVNTDTDSATDTDTSIDTDTATDKDTDTSSDVIDYDVDIPAGVITALGANWFTSPDGSDEVSTVSSIDTLENGGLSVNIDLNNEEYTYLVNFTGGVDLSSHSTVNVVVYNPNEQALQIQPIFKVGKDWTWTEYDQYQQVEAKTATMLTFDMSTASRTAVNAMIFRIQSGGTKCAGNLDFISIDYDLSATAYKNQLAEINRPKSASFFTWAYPESDWTAHTTSSSCENGKITVAFSGITTNYAAGVQTETKPGLGTGMDLTDYTTLHCKIKNNSSNDIHITLVVKTGGGWLWQENGGFVVGEEDGERVIPAGETVDVTYFLKGSTWKSADSNWQYTGTLSGAEDARAIAFKIYTGQSETATGSVEISDFYFDF